MEGRKVIKIRDYKIDNVRAIAMLCIILAHCGPPSILNNLRSFDVITLVFLSSYVINVNKIYDFKSYKEGIGRRAKRLFVPTGVFIVGMSIFQFVIYKIAGRNDLLTTKTVLNSFLLCENSIGYVWIMKVYFVNFAMTPLLIMLVKKIKHIWQYLMLVLIYFFTYLVCLNCYNVSIQHSYITWIFVNEWILCCMFYLIIGLDAIYYKINDLWNKYSIIFWTSILLGTCFFYKKCIYFAPAADKRPAGIQYLAYGLAITYFLLKIIPNKEIRFFRWISINSMEIYYSHTFFVFIMSCIQSILKIDNELFWILRFAVALIGALLVSKCIENTRLKLKEKENEKDKTLCRKNDK